ncbi:MAG: chloride channel protein [Gammaproteobacteria bacterium]|nr:chloride channel protein [Gammaproteobacteria bacterium]
MIRNQKFKRFFKPSESYLRQELSMSVMALLAILVGIVAGFGAVVFRLMIGFIHNLMFTGHIRFLYDANVHTTVNPWGWLIIFVPVIGAIAVVWLVKTFAPEAKGHGVPEVLEAIHFNGGKIRPIVVVIKSLASAISIGTGGSVGREGPIVQIGAAFGSLLGVLAKLSAEQRNVLIAAGAAGGIAATFNTPVGALAFAIELMLMSVNAFTLFPLGLSVVTATYIGRLFLGMTPSFYIPELGIPMFHLIALKVLLIFIPFGILIGLFSMLFLRSIYWFEDLFDRFSGSYYVRHLSGMFVIGLIMYAFFRFSGHYYVEGVGYATIVDVLSSTLSHPMFLLLLAFAKLLSTDLTLGSGASGGIFSPALFLGATFGAAIGSVSQMIVPGFGSHPIYFAIAGMAGMIGGSTGAVITAVTMVIEMTQDNNVILPIIVAATTAYAVRKLFSEASIYTMKLLRRGEIVQEGLQAMPAFKIDIARDDP